MPILIENCLYEYYPDIVSRASLPKIEGKLVPIKDALRTGETSVYPDICRAILRLIQATFK